MDKLQRSRQIGLAALIAALHFIALEALLALRPPAPAPQTELPPLTIVTLPRLQELGPAPADAAPSTAPLAIPSLAPPPLPALPEIKPAGPDPAVAALGQYLACRMPGQLQLTEDKERCARIMRDLPVGPLPDLPPTEEEKALARMFDHNQKVLEAPMLVPCLMGAMIQPLCIAATLLGGGDFITTYADVNERPHEPLATGMVGRSGKTPGAP